MAGVYYVLVVVVSLKNFLVAAPGHSRSLVRKLYDWCRRWYPTQVRSRCIHTEGKLYFCILKVFGSLLIAFPIISLYANLTLENLDIEQDSKRNFFMNLLVVTLIHFCNFTQVINSILIKTLSHFNRTQFY